MQTVATYIPLRTESVLQARRQRRLWWRRIETGLFFLANLTCTIVFAWLLVWLAGEMWTELMR